MWDSRAIVEMQRVHTMVVRCGNVAHMGTVIHEKFKRACRVMVKYGEMGGCGVLIEGKYSGG